MEERVCMLRRRFHDPLRVELDVEDGRKGFIGGLNRGVTGACSRCDERANADLRQEDRR